MLSSYFEPTEPQALLGPRPRPRPRPAPRALRPWACARRSERRIGSCRRWVPPPAGAEGVRRSSSSRLVAPPFQQSPKPKSGCLEKWGKKNTDFHITFGQTDSGVSYPPFSIPPFPLRQSSNYSAKPLRICGSTLVVLLWLLLVVKLLWWLLLTLVV